MKGKLAAAVGAMLVSLGLGSTSWASLLVDIKPDPPSPLNNELTWNGTNLFETPVGPNGGGAISNGDGVAAATLGPQHQTIGGLLIGTPVDLSGTAGGLAALGGITNSTDKSTTFYDVTLHLTLLNGVPPANVNPIVPGITVLSQPIGRGTFELLSTPDVVSGAQTLLLSGTVTDMVIVGLQNQTTASVQSTTVTYTNGLILGQWLKMGGQASGQLSLSLLDVNTPGGLQVGANTNLKAFDANMTGLLSAIPEPASLSVFGLAALGLIRRNRK